MPQLSRKLARQQHSAAHRNCSSRNATDPRVEYATCEQAPTHDLEGSEIGRLASCSEAGHAWMDDFAKTKTAVCRRFVLLG